MFNDTITLPKPFNVADVRGDFPVLQTYVNGAPLVYFDNGATTQKPWAVLRAMEDYYTGYNSNVHRGVHTLSQQATAAYEAARETIAKYINAASVHEVVYTKGTTDSVNLVASTYGKKYVKEGDVVIISAMEHHSNIVPWQMLCEDKGATLKVIPFDENGELRMDAFKEMLDERVKLVSLTHVSNTMGTINPVKEIIALAHALNIPVMLDGAQAIAHLAVDVQDLDVDFYAFSSHKIYGPTGIGVLYGKEKWLNDIPPYQGGGDMIKTVTFAKTIYNDPPLKFEAGTPAIAESVGLGAALQYLMELDLAGMRAYEHHLNQVALEKLRTIDELRFIGNAKERNGAISFMIGNHHPTDVGELLDQQGIAVRTGHHCTQPLMDIFCIPGTVRASLTFYNTEEEVDKLVAGIKKAVIMLNK
ncbi:cysteine desulfurase/selenocysteine lyase [Chitinophaga skermanii]|uniref:Cysteine desulfurase n=1 Tax=Chitinophaga skermanii TaxID=331697 RepID=A0A327QQ45_9BACT|nr:cysteine desulfurase [Chitinophaga skermanii]RAJ06699.1 cysteine desulfurase/selenocysteine lyase [Chitinophaga skermanii]